MIQEIRIKNYLSFKEEVVLNFEVTKDTTFEEYQVVNVAPKVRLLRFALIYGANASGKSNLLSAFSFLRTFWFGKKSDMDESTGTIPFLLDTETPESPSEFDIKFYIKGIRYWYSLRLTQRQVLSETLHIYKSVQPSLLFSREMLGGQSVVKLNPAFGKVSQAVLDELNSKCLPNMSFFAARNQVNCSLPAIDEVSGWMKNKVLLPIGPGTEMFAYAGTQMMKDAGLKKYILDFVHKADYNITGMDSQKETRPLPRFMQAAIREFDGVSQKEREYLLANGQMETVKTDFLHTVRNSRGTETYAMPQELQSSGTRRTVGIEAAIYEAVNADGILPVDEIESSLHPDLVEFIIEMFLKQKGQSQLIVTSHYDPLLNTVNDLIRKDSVWFTEKEENGCSSLYSLVDFKGLGKISSFQRSYRNGLFGALPNIHS